MYNKVIIHERERIYMRLLICDDDMLMLEQLQKYIRTYFEKAHIKCPEIVCYHDGESLLADKNNIDILFLDVEMPGMNGIYVGKELKQRNHNIIIFIITSYAEYLDEAMRFHVFRYLSKPIDRQRLFRNMRDAMELYHRMNFRIAIETKQGIYTVPTSSIIAIEAQFRKVIVHTTNGSYESIHNIQYWLEILPHNCFFQSHRSFIINFEHVTDFDHTLIHMADNQFHAYLTKRRYTAFKESYLLYLESTR